MTLIAHLQRQSKSKPFHGFHIFPKFFFSSQKHSRLFALLSISAEQASTGQEFENVFFLSQFHIQYSPAVMTLQKCFLLGACYPQSFCKMMPDP